MSTRVAPVFATIFRSDEAPLAATLAEGIMHHHPGAAIYAVLLDDDGSGAVPRDATGVAITDLGFTHEQGLVLQLTTRTSDARMVVAPALVAHLLRTTASAPVVYLSPDTRVCAALPALPASGITMLSRLSQIPPDDGRTPDRDDLLRLSALDDGFLAAAPDAADVLDAATPSLFAAATSSDAALGRAWDLIAVRAGATVLDDASLGVAYWNATDRPGPFTTVRLPGLDPDTPYLLSRDQSVRPRVLLSERPDLRAVTDGQLAALRAHGMTTALTAPRLGSLTIDDAVRYACRQALHDDPSFTRGLAALMTDPTGETLAVWLSETCPGSREPRVSRYLMGLWESNEYASTAFPNPTDDQSEHFIRWVRTSSETVGVPARYLPRPTDAAAYPAGEPAVQEPQALEHGVNLVGFLRAGFGIGEATRLLHEALIAGEIPHAAISVSHDDLDDKVESSANDEKLVYDINLICVNVDWLDMLSRRLGSDLMAERYFIGTWWWESNLLPPELVAQIDYFDELWAGSNYVADALRQYTDLPIRVFPLPVRVPDDEPPPDREQLGLPDGYLFMFSFDFNSTVERKNPEGVIEAFRRAFPSPAGTHLVIKTINGERHLTELERLRALTADRDDITIYDGFLPTADRDAWARATDCYVSLHRCEGFGLTMAEAMALAKPVIATGYSANLDFMDSDTAMLVPANKWVLDDGAGPYPAGTIWADPDLDAAATFMRSVASDPGAAVALGARARAHIASTRTTDRLARFVASRLEEIRMEDRQLRPRPNVRLTSRLNDALSYDRQRQGVRHSALGRMINKVIRPYSASADELDRRMLAAMVELGGRLDDLDRGLDGTEQIVEALGAEVREQTTRKDVG